MRWVSSQCEVCRRWNAARLCDGCVARFAPAVSRCARCALRVADGVTLCGECLREVPAFEHTVCALDYAFPWDRLIVAFKFHDQVELAAPLAAQLVRAVRASRAPAPTLVIPIPLASQRLAERGYNQAWELARRAAAALDLPCSATILLRPVETAHQAELTRAERLANLRNAFMADPRQRGRLEGVRVALVDDVLTTGATARHGALALLRAGAAAVDIWVIARTPEPH